MNEVYEKLQCCLAAVKKKVTFEPKVALILGSGLGDYAEQMDIKAMVDYSDIDGFPTSTVAGHKGRLYSDMLRKFLLLQCRAGYITMRDTLCQMWFFL